MIKVFSDGGSRGNPGKAACAFVVFKDGSEIYRKGEYLGVVTNNVAEYTGLAKAVEWLLKNNYTHEVGFYLDSELVVKQINKIYKIKNINLKNLNNEVLKKLENKFSNYTVSHVPRQENTIADKLVNDVLDEN